MTKTKIPIPDIDPDDGMSQVDHEARANNKLVLDIARLLDGRSSLEIGQIIREVQKLIGITTVFDVRAPAFREQEALFEFHFGPSKGDAN